MPGEDKTILVYDDFSTDTPILLGRLYVGVIKGGESYSFEYDKDWLAKNKLSIHLDPELQPFSGRQFPSGRNIFGLFADASPDRWGRVLMNKRERILVKRFDRDGEKRIHFASAMTLLGKTDGASAEDGTSYLDMVGFIKAYGATPKPDLIELWRRIVFNMAVSNTDDHLRNHAFIFTKNGWTLSPLYDVNPVPYGDELALLVDAEDNSISVDLAIRTAPLFGITEKEATKFSREVLIVVRDNWERLAKEYGLSRGQIEDMRPAFSACYSI